MVPQKHGGALLPGGVPGNKGGGRPPNELRGSMREILEKGLPHLEEFATGEKDASPSDQLKAIDIAAKFRIGPNRGHDEQLVGKLAHVTAEVFAGDERLEVLHKRWIVVIGDHIRGEE